MPDTPEKRIEQLTSIVNELTARIAGDPGNADLPPLLASAQAELTALQGASGAPAAASVAAPVARPKIVAPAPLVAKPATAPAAKPVPAAKPATTTPAAKPAAIPAAKRPETGLGKAGTRRPAPAVPRPAPTNPALTKAPAKR